MSFGGGLGQSSLFADNAQDRESERHFAGWVYAAIRPIAQRIAAQPIRLGFLEDQGAGRERAVQRFEKDILPGCFKGLSENLEMVEEHAALQALRSPNPTLTSWSLMFTTVVNLELTGRQHWWIKQVKGQPLPQILP